MDAIPTDQHIEDALAMLKDLPSMADGVLFPDVMRIATALAARDDDQRRGLGGNLPPEPIDPENLLRLPPANIPDLLLRSYQPLIRRGAALLENADYWQIDLGKAMLTNQQQADDLADQMDQIAKYAHIKTGEVEGARKRVKEPIYEAGKKIDTFFSELRNRLLEIAGMEPYGSGPATMQGKLSAWQRAKVERERAERAAAAQRAQAEADAKLAAARQSGDDDAIVDATVAEETAVQAQRAAAAPARDLARSTTARGTTVGLRANWVFEVEDFRALVLAAAVPEVMARLSDVQDIAASGLLPKIRAAITPAGGPVPLEYLAPADPIIRAAIKGDRGRRDCPGIRIFNDAQASRRGG